MYAIIETCGKQYKVSEGDVVFFEKLDAEEGKKVKFDKIILISDNGKVEVGTPYVKGATVEGKVIENGKAKKIIVFKYKAKKNYRRKQGHRQPFSKVEITSVKVAKEKSDTQTKVAEKEVAKETAAKKTTTKSAEKKETTKTITTKKTAEKKETAKKTVTKKEKA